MGNIATTRFFENEKISVWEMVLEPGESCDMHTHNNDYLFYVLEGSTAELVDGQGKSMGALELKPGDKYFFKVEGQELVAGDLRIPRTHLAKNVGKTRYRELLVESKGK